jgi:hypothetical protein
VLGYHPVQPVKSGYGQSGGHVPSFAQVCAYYLRMLASRAP